MDNVYLESPDKAIDENENLYNKVWEYNLTVEPAQGYVPDKPVSQNCYYCCQGAAGEGCGFKASSNPVLATSPQEQTKTENPSNPALHGAASAYSISPTKISSTPYGTARATRGYSAHKQNLRPPYAIGMGVETVKEPPYNVVASKLHRVCPCRRQNGLQDLCPLLSCHNHAECLGRFARRKTDLKPSV